MAKESLLESSISSTVILMTLSLLAIKDLRNSFMIFVPNHETLTVNFQLLRAFKRYLNKKNRIHGRKIAMILCTEFLKVLLKILNLIKERFC